MAIQKNTPAEAKPAKEVKAPTKAASKSVTKPAPKAAPKAEPKADKPVKVAADAQPTSLAKEPSLKISRKELALAIRAKVTKSGAAVSAKVAEICAVAYEEAVAEALAAGQEVVLPGFGKFIATSKEAAEKRNPSTGAMVLVPAHKAVRFRVGSKLKAAVNGGAEVGEDSEE